jgi:hypothetical protein
MMAEMLPVGAGLDLIVSTPVVLQALEATGRAVTCTTEGSNSKPSDKGTLWPNSVEEKVREIRLVSHSR